MSTKYVLVSLPLGIFDSSDKEDAIASLSATISPENGNVRPFNIPDFKIGTLDALVQQADDLAKLESTCEAVVAKVADSLKSILDGDEDKIAQQKMVNDKPTDQYVSSFSWNKVRYRADKSLSELVDTLQKELITTDNDVKSKFNQYNSVKTNFTTLQRKQTGNLATKSLTPIVDPAILIQDSEYLETHLIVVPNNAKKDFLRSYETLAPMVVPRSAAQVAQDDEFTLYSATSFKKHSAEFLQKCREQKWTPRQYKYVEGGKEEEQRELDRVAREEKKTWGEALRIGRTGWSESVMIWLHVLALRVFVEAVLRYGLPLDYVSVLVKTNSKLAKKVKTSLDSNYSYLGGNAFGRDKRGKITKDDATLSSEMAAAGLGGGEGHEYTAYVYYEFDFP
ncbi:V-type proton ATPase subunit C [Colletotrichum gloeosporioides]|uniref:V-type proton ATPase subunit C n=2 Tax=Colletotrichum gloeosporioides TaxID=474922 RepID=T0JVN1_COLGC|nr:V-type proton ATPase subunit C [Colletotrichum gloeosporioides]EQB44613.1 V-ATPase subunit C [Colletotrichum gloeosporioides Cg-14]KAF3804960.1 V-type proton ATPase subunit C [Colletotrichum gloeosporioides]